MTILNSYAELGNSITTELDRCEAKLSIRQTAALNFIGLQNARDLILASVQKL